MHYFDIYVLISCDENHDIILLYRLFNKRVLKKQVYIIFKDRKNVKNLNIFK